MNFFKFNAFQIKLNYDISMIYQYDMNIKTYIKIIFEKIYIYNIIKIQQIYLRILFTYFLKNKKINNSTY